MRLAPQLQLAGVTVTIRGGVAGVRQTLDAMRSMVRRYRVDPAIRQAATSIVFLTPEKDELGEVDALFRWVQEHVRYVRDVHEVETLSAPDKVLAGRVGDCDDQATLLATMLEAIGYPTRFVATGYQRAGELEHVHLQVFAGGDWIDLDPTEREAVGWAPPGPVAMLIERTTP